MSMKNEPSRIDAPAGEDTTTLTISPEKVCFIMAASPTPRRSNSGCAIASIPAAILVTSIAALASRAGTEALAYMACTI